MNDKFHKRKTTRYKDYSYNQYGYYFITTCVNNRLQLFGSIKKGKVILNDIGKIVKKNWLNLSNYYSNCELDYYIIMPDHFHGIIIVNQSVGDRSPVPNEKTQQQLGDGGPIPYKKIGSIINMMAYFKYQSTIEINQLLKSPCRKIWQRSFYDRIIRNERELYNIRKYIEQNPLKWDFERTVFENLYL